MSVSASFRTFVLEQLGRTIPAVRDKRMFGGVGIYAGEVFFALIDDDTLYLKVDDSNRPDFEARGLSAFRPFGDDRVSMQYYEVPEDLLEDAETLGLWARKAIDVARRAKTSKTKGGRRRKT